MGQKYRQHGYMDGDWKGKRGRKDDEAGGVVFGSMLKVLVCKKCSERNKFVSKVNPDSVCSRCGTSLHSCVHCKNYDRQAKFQCKKPIENEISEKMERNECSYFDPMLKADSSAKKPMTADEAKKALDKLFKI